MPLLFKTLLNQASPQFEGSRVLPYRAMTENRNRSRSSCPAIANQLQAAAAHSRRRSSSRCCLCRQQRQQQQQQPSGLLLNSLPLDISFNQMQSYACRLPLCPAAQAQDTRASALHDSEGTNLSRGVVSACCLQRWRSVYRQRCR